MRVPNGNTLKMLWTVQTEAMDPSCKSLHNLKKKEKVTKKDIKPIANRNSPFDYPRLRKKDVLGSREKPPARNEKSLNNAWEMGLSRLFDLPRINAHSRMHCLGISALRACPIESLFLVSGMFGLVIIRDSPIKETFQSLLDEIGGL